MVGGQAAAAAVVGASGAVMRMGLIRWEGVEFDGVAGGVDGDGRWRRRREGRRAVSMVGGCLYMRACLLRHGRIARK